MSKQTYILAFYTSYFIWLLVVIMLFPYPDILTFFLVVILLFYLIFLQEAHDWLYFFAGVLYAYFLMRVFSKSHITITDLTATLPISWMLIWGISVLAFRKFFILLTRRKSILTP